MCDSTCNEFARLHLLPADIAGKRVLEVGSRLVNGSLRPQLEALGPAAYIGVDIEAGPGVDDICSAEDLILRFGSNSFDVVVSTEMLEHVRAWRRVVSNFKNLLRPGGVLLVTTRSIGFSYHAHPHDFWRFEPEDVRAIFSDLTLASVVRDPASPGVFFVARKPSDFRERELHDYALHSIVLGRRSVDVSDLQLRMFHVLVRTRDLLARTLPAPVRSLIRRVVRTPGVDRTP